MTRADEAAAVQRTKKSANAFRTTGEVAEELELSAHVLRFWESRFTQIKPLKRGGRRYYRPADVDLLRRIRRYLYEEGYTIRGVQKLLRQDELSTPPIGERVPATLFELDPVAAPLGPTARPAPSREALQAALEAVRSELTEVRLLLDKLLKG